MSIILTLVVFEIWNIIANIATNKINIITMLTVIDDGEQVPATRTDSKTFNDIITETENNLRKLLNVPNNYKILLQHMEVNNETKQKSSR